MENNDGRKELRVYGEFEPSLARKHRTVEHLCFIVPVLLMMIKVFLQPKF